VLAVADFAASRVPVAERETLAKKRRDFRNRFTLGGAVGGS